MRNQTIRLDRQFPLIHHKLPNKLGDEFRDFVGVIKIELAEHLQQVSRAGGAIRGLIPEDVHKAGNLTGIKVIMNNICMSEESSFLPSLSFSLYKERRAEMIE